MLFLGQALLDTKRACAIGVALGRAGLDSWATAFRLACLPVTNALAGLGYFDFGLALAGLSHYFFMPRGLVRFLTVPKTGLCARSAMDLVVFLDFLRPFMSVTAPYLGHKKTTCRKGYYGQGD